MVDKKCDSYDHFFNFASVSCFVVPARAWGLVAFQMGEFQVAASTLFRCIEGRT